MKMKKMILFAAAILTLNMAAADYATLMQEGAAAKKAGNKELAVQKYAEAHKLAKGQKQEYDATLAYAAALQSNKQKGKARDVYEAELKKDIYTNSQRQSMLVKIAAMYLWDSKNYQYALDKINLALAIKGVRDDDILYFLMCNYAACIYMHFKKEYDPVIVLCEPAAAKSKIPWHKWTLYSQVSQAYEKLGKKTEALKNYKLALEFAKKAKKNVSAKNIEKLEKKIQELSK